MAVTINGTTGITSPGLSVDSPTLVVDDANNRVGIGTDNPPAELTVDGFVVIGNPETTGSGGTLRIAESSNSIYIQPGSNLSNDSSCDLIVSSIYGATEKLRIDSAGRVGIGGNGIGNGLGVFLRRSSPNTTHFYEASDGTKTMITGVDSTNDYVKIGSLSNHRLGLVANNGEKLSILPSGNVGIGSTQPTAKLDVNGVLSCGPGIAPFISAKFRDYNDGSAIYASVVQAGGGKFISGESYYFNSGFWRSDTTTSTAIGLDSGNIRFLTRSGLTANTDFNGPYERMRIHSDGNVTIGPITTPADFITVYNSNNGNPTGITIRNTEASSQYSHARLRLESQNAAAYGEIWADVANAGLRLGYNSSNTVKINSSGNIVFNSGSGIDFSATSDGTGVSNVSELLDDYEKGTFTPRYNTTSFNIGTVTYDNNNSTGVYVKIGKQVFVTLVMRTTGISGGTGSGSLIITGLPFVPNNSISPRSVASISEVGDFGAWSSVPSNSNPPVFWGQNYIHMRVASSSLSTGNPGNFLMLSGTYTVA